MDLIFFNCWTYLKVIQITVVFQKLFWSFGIFLIVQFSVQVVFF